MEASLHLPTAFQPLQVGLIRAVLLRIIVSEGLVNEDERSASPVASGGAVRHGGEQLTGLRLSLSVRVVAVSD
jgi:hypothetical protein